jgi:hypothetical protein
VHAKLVNVLLQVLSEKSRDCLRSPNFLTASAESIQFLLKQDNLAVKSEVKLVEYCSKWAENQDDPK